MAEQNILLQPVAHLTDQYAAPEIRRKIPGQQRLELGQAMRGLNPQVDAITNRIIDSSKDLSVEHGR